MQQPERRPPITTPEGCFLSYTMRSVFFVLALLIGGTVGSAIGGEQGALIGFVSLGILSMWTPWRRYVLRWWQGGDRDLAGETPPTDEPPRQQ